MIRPVLFKCDPEKCHNVVIRALEMAGPLHLPGCLLGAGRNFHHPRLETKIGTISFRNPLGLAAGFDKSGRAINALARLGFGHVEIGSISAQPSAGNPKPRLWRLIKDQATLVHYGLPNDGAQTVARRLHANPPKIPLGINIVTTNKGPHVSPDTDDQILTDYLQSVRLLKNAGAYLALNLSCPNTTHGCDFFSVPGNTRTLLLEVAKLKLQVPLFLKISAAGGIPRIESLLQEVDNIPTVSGFAFNLTSEKPPNLLTNRALWENRRGAVSGKPIESIMNSAISNLFARINPTRYQIIGSGGIFTPEDAYLKIRLGASLIQVLTALIYEGPAVVNRINRGLSHLLERDGFASVAQAVGTLKSPVATSLVGTT